MSVCSGTKRDGDPCTLPAMAGERYCYNHHPDYAEERHRSASHAATTKHNSVSKELREVRELIWELLTILLSDELPLRVRKELQSVVQLLQCYLRAAELEMRAAEEPLESGLDVAGLKAQVLERVENLEEQERERTKVLAELMPVMEAWGYDSGVVKEMISG